ncbi:DinB family protein [Sabulilitoribacter multivorans]|uniref:DinB family protein n=1 Tax=Flaviramulus multivorans TaxID=1304750 RepID=A0ABS9IKS9_9FLAO|nr:DinB family protein [Flaviramulus multivorans]MCF7561177.1 DinB family protein [Flaviramulus multivorans]
MKKYLTILLCFGFIISINAQREIKSEEGFTPQIGVIVSMLNDMKNRVENTVKNLDIESTDFLLDENANSIGTLVLHLAATEKFYQVYTFENREFNKEEQEEWGMRMSMGNEAREMHKGKPISYYLNIYDEVRQKTLEYLKGKDDVWLAQTPEGYRMNNHWSWYHVMEHQSSHLGQILLLKKRIP